MSDSKKPKSTHLEVATLSLDVVKSNTRERRSLPRVSVSSEQIKINHSGRLFAVVDVSEGGLALCLSDPIDYKDFIIGYVYIGVLNLRHRKFNVHVKIRNIQKGRIGCEFQDPSTELLDALKEFMDPTFLGAGLRPMPSPGNNMIWYQGPSGTHLFMRRQNDGQFDQIALYFLDFYVQWEAELGLSTGNALNSDQQSEFRGIMTLETFYLEVDEDLNDEKMSIAKKIIVGSNLPEDLKGWCLRQFSR